MMKKYRNEWKYLCRETDLAVLEQRFGSLLELDEHAGDSGIYEIHSLYFDDHKDSCAWDNDVGTDVRFKYRIRYYGTDLNTLHLERKEKLHGLCTKLSCKLSVQQYQDILEGNAEQVFWNTDQPLLKQFCRDIMTDFFEPKVIVDYQRTAFVEPISNVRITLDQNITASNEISAFLEPEYMSYPLLELGRHILEVKFDDILPGQLKRCLCTNFLVQTAFSKYYLSRNLIHKLGRY